MSDFDPGPMLDFASGLLWRARLIVFAGILAGAVGGYAVGSAFNGATLVAVGGGIVGAAFGSSRAFAYRLAAQQTLWQVAVEHHLSLLVIAARR